MSFPQTPQEVHDDSYAVLADEQAHFERLLDETKRAGFPIDGLDSVISDADLQAKLTTLDAEEDKQRRTRQPLVEIERRADDLLATKEAKELIDKLDKGQTPAGIIVSWLKDIISEDDSLAVKLYDLVNKTGSNVINSRRVAVAKVKYLVASVDIEGKNQKIDEFEKLNLQLTKRIRDLEFEDGVKRISLGRLVQENANLEAELAVRPLDFQIEGETEKRTKKVKDILANGQLVSTFPKRWSELKDLLDQQSNLDNDTFKKRLAVLQQQLDDVENNRMEANNALKEDQNQRAILQKSLTAVNTQLAELTQQLDSNTIKHDQKMLALQRNNEQLSIEKSSLTNELRQKEFDIEARIAETQTQNDKIKQLKNEVTRVNEDFNKYKVQAAQDAGEEGSEVKHWTEKYTKEVQFRQNDALRVKTLQDKLDKLELDINEKDQTLLKNVEDAGELSERATKTGTDLKAAMADIAKLERMQAEKDALIKEKIEIVQDTENTIANVTEKLMAANKDGRELQQMLIDQQLDIENARQQFKQELHQSAQAEEARTFEAAKKLKEIQESARATEEDLQQQISTLETAKSSLTQEVDRTNQELHIQVDLVTEWKHNLNETTIKLKHAAADVLAKDTLIRFLQTRLSTSEEKQILLKARIEQNNQLTRQRDEILQEAENLKTKISDWNRVAIHHQYAFQGTVHPDKALTFLKISWPTNQGVIDQKIQDMLGGFDLLGLKHETAFDVWVRSTCDPTSLTHDHLIAVLRYGVPSRHIGFIVAAVINVNELETLEDETALFLVRSIEFLYLIMNGHQSLQPVLEAFSQLGTKLPDVPLVQAFYNFVKNRLDGGFTTRGAQLLNSLSSYQYLEISSDVKAFTWGQVVVVAAGDRIEIRKPDDLRAKVSGTQLVVWIVGVPLPGSEAELSLDLNADNVERMAQLFPTAKWGANI